MDNYQITRTSSPVGFTFLGVTFNPAGIQTAIYKSLAAKIGLIYTRTKLCPFCEETIKKDASICRFCNRTLMKQINLKARK
jgi:hypothetical protein